MFFVVSQENAHATADSGQSPPSAPPRTELPAGSSTVS